MMWQYSIFSVTMHTGTCCRSHMLPILSVALYSLRKGEPSTSGVGVQSSRWWRLGKIRRITVQTRRFFASRFSERRPLSPHAPPSLRYRRLCRTVPLLLLPLSAGVKRVGARQHCNPANSAYKPHTAVSKKHGGRWTPPDAFLRESNALEHANTATPEIVHINHGQ